MLNHTEKISFLNNIPTETLSPSELAVVLGGKPYLYNVSARDGCMTLPHTVTGTFGVIENSSRYIKGECTGKECAIGIADACASAAVSAISTELGRRFIPIPFLGPLIGNAAGTLLYKVAKKPIIRLFNSFMDAEPCIA